MGDVVRRFEKKIKSAKGSKWTREIQNDRWAALNVHLRSVVMKVKLVTLSRDVFSPSPFIADMD